MLIALDQQGTFLSGLKMRKRLSWLLAGSVDWMSDL
jgi:hypothetical protein